jgi:hypothetical protein
LEKIVKRVRVYITEYRNAASFDANAECFAALELFVRREAVLTRMRTLLHKMDYRRLCGQRDEASRLVRMHLKDKNAPVDVARVLALVDDCYNDVAGVLFSLPRLIPLTELKSPSQKTIGDMMWSEPIPILIDEDNSEATKYHLMPTLDDVGLDLKESAQSRFLWGRRALVSLPLGEWLKEEGEKRAVSPEQMELMLRLLFRKHQSEWQRFSALVRETMITIRQRRSHALDETIASTAVRFPAAAAVLRAIRKQYEIAGLYYGRQRGARRVRTMRRRKPGVPYTQETEETVSKLNWLKDRIAEANQGIKERASSLPAVTDDGTSPDDLTERVAAADRDTGIDLYDVLALLKQQLGKPEFDNDTIKRLSRLFMVEFSAHDTQAAAPKRTSSS